jgi:hypothetical protein
MIDRMRARVLGLLRLNAVRSPSLRVRRAVLLIALALFAGVTIVALRDLPPLPTGRRQPALLAPVAALSMLSSVVNGGEYALSARALGGHVTLRDATRISVLTIAANLLPIPGAALVKTRALQRRGARLRIAATLTIAIGVVWVGVAGVVAGIFVAIAGHHGVLAISLAGAGAVIPTVGAAILANQTTELAAAVLVGAAVAIEIGSVGLTALRFYLVMRAIGFGGSFGQASTLAATAIVSSAAGVFPGGLGLRELLSSAVGPAVGLSAAVATVVAAVERIVTLAVVAVMALVVMVADRPRADLSPPPDSAGAADGEKT